MLYFCHFTVLPRLVRKCHQSRAETVGRNIVIFTSGYNIYQIVALTAWKNVNLREGLSSGVPTRSSLDSRWVCGEYASQAMFFPFMWLAVNFTKWFNWCFGLLVAMLHPRMCILQLLVRCMGVHKTGIRLSTVKMLSGDIYRYLKLVTYPYNFFFFSASTCGNH